LDIKQKYANVCEARFAREESQTAARQAEISAQQGKARNYDEMFSLMDNDTYGAVRQFWFLLLLPAFLSVMSIVPFPKGKTD
jgi:hypothetical protein